MAPSLSELGLNKYEERVYLTLVAEGISTAKNISDITSIPYGKVYEVMNSLSTKGFLTILPTKPMKFQGVSPKDAIANAKKSLQSKFEKIEKHVLKELEPAFAKTRKFMEAKSIFLVVNGRANINNKIEELIKNAKDHINIFISENGLKRLVMFRDLLKAANKKGVQISISGVVTSDNLEDVDDLNFCEIKHIGKTQNHFFSADGKECLVVEPIADDENLVFGRDLGILISSSSFAGFFEDFFNSNFKYSKQLDKRLLEIKRR